MSNRMNGKRYEDSPKLNIKKVLATIIAIIVLILIIFSLKNLFSNGIKTKDVSSLTSYFDVFEDGKWGVIDNKGNEILGTNYDNMILIPDNTRDIFVIIMNNNESNYTTKVLDCNNNEILTEYSKIEPLANTDGNKNWYDTNLLKFQKDGKVGLINFEGKIVLDASYDDIYSLQGIDKSIIIEKNGLYGLVNSASGEIVVPVKYIDIKSLSDTYQNGYIVCDSNAKYGVIAPDGSVVLDNKYDCINNVTGNNLYSVVENGCKEIVNNKGEVVLNSGFDEILQIDTDIIVIKTNNKYAVINNKGENLIPANYDYIEHVYSNNYIVSQNGKFGIIDSSLKTILDLNYINIEYKKNADLFIAYKEDSNVDILNRNFDIKLSDVKLDLFNLDEGYIKVTIQNNVKYYNFKLEEQSNIETFSTNTLFLIKQNDKYGYVNKNGDIIVDCIYDNAMEQNAYGYCSVCKDGKWGSLNSDGTVNTEPKYDCNDFVTIDFISNFYKINDTLNYIYTK